MQTNTLGVRAKPIHGVMETSPAEVMMTRLKRVDKTALDLLIDSGPGYFNPMIGVNAAETFDKLEAGMEFLTECLDEKFASFEGKPGLALFAQTMWAACQYESNKRRGGLDAE